MAGRWQRLDTSGVTVARSEASRGGWDGRRVAEAGHQQSDRGEVRGQQMRKGWQWGWQRLGTSGVTVARSEASRGGRSGRRVAEV